MRRDPFVVGIVATVLVLALITVGTLLVVDDGGSDLSRPATPAEVDAAVAKLSAFVEAERDLEVPDDLDIDLLTGRRFRQAFDGGEDLSIEDLFGDVTTTWMTLGLIDASVELEGYDAPSPFAFYDPFRERIVVQSRTIDPLIESVLAHELTHAAQDHAFGDSESFPDDEEDALAYLGLIEGDATRIEERYRDQLSESERDEYDEHEQRLVEEGEAFVAEVPEADRAAIAFLERQVLFPYDQGAAFVRELADEGGNQAADEALDEPPTTTEQVLHPEKFQDDEEAVAVDDLDPPDITGVDEIDNGTFGEFLLRELLDARGVERDEARAAAAGWGGDRYVTWRADEGLGLRATIVMDTEADAAELEAALAGSTDTTDSDLVSLVRTGTVLDVEFAATA